MRAHDRIILITYPDSMGRNIRELTELLNGRFKDAVGGVHLLPFFPSSGDRGFAPLCYDRVEERFGNWDDIRALAEGRTLIADYMINHISAQSAYFKDFLQKGDDSPYADYFLRCGSFWYEEEPTKEQLDMIYKRRPRAPFMRVEHADGSDEDVWCTFSEQQIDTNCFSPGYREFLARTLTFLAEKGVNAVRLDAFAYCTKKRGTNCFFVQPEAWELLDYCRGVLEPYGACVLPEIHEHYSYQLQLAEHGYPAYDFALPMLLLHALYFCDSRPLKRWLEICPRDQFNTLDTHDGIGVVDVRGLLDDDEIERTREAIFRCGANVKHAYSTAAYNNLDVYQINCTYYSALGDDDKKYLIARAVQFFSPGTPMVYYVGLLAGRNDVALLESTKEGRSINRHYYSADEALSETERPVVKRLLEIMELRNTHPAFMGGISLEECADDCLRIRRQSNDEFAELSVNLTAAAAELRLSGINGDKPFSLC